MHFIKSADATQGKTELLNFLNISLKRERVLWLVSGGSNIPTEVSILNELDDNLTSRLSILLTDERYGRRGHEASNYRQLASAGFNIKEANFPDILDQNLAPAQTLERFTQTFELLKSQSTLSVAQLGIGDDGHIAGVLPNSAGISTTDSVIYYESEPYKRLSLSLNSLRALNKVVVFCFGDNKREALSRLKSGQETLESLPSLILREIPDVTVYNDQLED